jgi:xylan 1,4-beta-xylosidase
LHFTEWSSSYTPTDPIHDQYHQAAFILDKIKGTEEAATSMSYWVFTDIFEENGPRTTPFHGGFGLLNYQGIRKPAFYAYKFLNELGETEIMGSDPASFVCTSRDGGLQVLLWDFTITYPGEPTTNQQFFKRDLPAASKGKVRVSLKGVSPGSYWLEGFRVGYRENDAYATYMDLGSPAQLTPAQVEIIKAENDGSACVKELIRVGADGRFDRQLDLRENDVYLLKLRPAR